MNTETTNVYIQCEKRSDIVIARCSLGLLVLLHLPQSRCLCFIIQRRYKKGRRSYRPTQHFPSSTAKGDYHKGNIPSSPQISFISRYSPQHLTPRTPSWPWSCLWRVPLSSWLTQPRHSSASKWVSGNCFPNCLFVDMFGIFLPVNFRRVQRGPRPHHCPSGPQGTDYCTVGMANVFLLW